MAQVMAQVMAEVRELDRGQSTDSKGVDSGQARARTGPEHGQGQSTEGLGHGKEDRNGRPKRLRSRACGVGESQEVAAARSCGRDVGVLRIVGALDSLILCSYSRHRECGHSARRAHGTRGRGRWSWQVVVGGGRGRWRGSKRAKVPVKGM